MALTIRQLSIFLENKSGRLGEVLSALAEGKINIIALTIADTSEYGILRLIVSHPEEACRLLKEKGFSVNLNDVISLEMGTQPGSLSVIMNQFSAANVGVEYLYAFSFGAKAVMVMRTTDRPLALEIIEINKFKLITESDLR